MKSRITAKEKNQFKQDFTTVLTFSLIANAKGLDKKDRQSIRECMAANRLQQALRIVERRYSPRGWKDFVEAQAQPILKGYVKELVKA